MNRVRVAVLLLLAVVPGAWASTSSTPPSPSTPPTPPSPPDFTLDPAMTKGARTAPVTIVEFSDYQ